MQYPVAQVRGAAWDACSQKSLGLASLICTQDMCKRELSWQFQLNIITIIKELKKCD